LWHRGIEQSRLIGDQSQLPAEIDLENSMFPPPSAPVDCTAAVAALVARFGDRVATGAAIRTAHGRGEGLHDVMAPAAVVFARSTADVADVVRVCRDHLVPLIPFGTGTSLEG
jgi:D-lactate dehydrogenase (cytochrome)